MTGKNGNVLRNRTNLIGVVRGTKDFAVKETIDVNNVIAAPQRFSNQKLFLIVCR